MRRLRLVVLWAALCLLTSGAWAQRAVPIHFTTTAAPSPVHPGETVTVTVHATVDPGWHVYSVVPTTGGPATTEIVSVASARSLSDAEARKMAPAIPTVPQAAMGTGRAGGLIFTRWTAASVTAEDAAVREVDPNFHLEVGYHEKQATFTRAFHVPDSAAAGNAPLTVTLHYQTCNDKICLPPTDVTLTAPLAVAAGPARAEYAKTDLPQVQAAPPTPNSGGAGAKTADGFALLPFLLTALGAGLLAILTPCVFPLIPITLTNFVKQAEGDKAKLVRLSGGYGLGIVALYVALGAVVAGTLGAAGANQIAANPWVNLVEFVLFVVFALSFFETIQIRVPGNLAGMQQTARKHSGTAGLLLLGTTFVLGSFTCTAPFVGTLLVTAANGQWARPILGMLIFALAFASPFFVFAAFPQWISRIPKGGLWLARFKATLGFLELAAALKFLSNADQVWQWKVLTQPVLLAAWAIICLLAALYLFGTLRFGVVAEAEPESERHKIPPARRAVAAIFTLAALYCFWGLAGRPLHPYVGAFLPPPGYGGVTEASASTELPWQSDYQAALAQAKSEGRPLLIDFTGYTCTNCRLNEKNVFPRKPVQTELANYVRVQLYTDGGPDGPKNQKLQQDKFGDVALPLYGVVNPQTEAVVDKTEGVQTIDGFRDFLSKSRLAMAPPAPKSGGAGTKIASTAPNLTPPDLGGGGQTPAWAHYTAAAVTQAVQQGKPTIVDFTAAWCINCKEIEHDVFEHPDVAPQLGRDFVTLRADLTDWNSPVSTALQKQYGFVALPTIIFLDASGHEIKPLRITGRLPVADFQKRMQAARGPGASATAVAALPTSSH